MYQPGGEKSLKGPLDSCVIPIHVLKSVPDAILLGIAAVIDSEDEAVGRILMI